MRKAPKRLLALLSAGALSVGLAACSSASASSADNTGLPYVDNGEAQEYATVEFGSYEQDGNESNGAEAIEWLVLDEQDGKTLLISAYVLDAQPYDDAEAGHDWLNNTDRVGEDVEWADCSLRDWLNDEFLDEAFTSDEQDAIVTTTLEDSKTNATRSVDDYADEDVAHAEATDDAVFLLSRLEAREYFPNMESRVAYPTAYAIEQGVYTGVANSASDGTIDENASGAAVWWLRSAGYYAGYASVVTDDGYVHGDGYRVAGELHDGNEDHGELSSDLGGNVGVRPCIWVDSSAIAS